MMQRHALNLPNLLTYARIVMVPVVAGLVMWGGAFAHWLALGIFIFAAITDFFDGWLARRWQLQSSLGRMLDPIADKLLVAAALLALVGDNTIEGAHLWAAIIILCREVLVSGLREYLAELRVSVPVTQLAKWKTAIQFIAMCFLIAGPAGDVVLPYNTQIGLGMLWMAAALTLYTGYDYFRAGVGHMMDDRT
jgi:CDP-diacylglycerol--glycerol-3-phosphate 3-phosphatidyltransferase